MRDQHEEFMFRSFVLADFVTIANVGCGMSSILLCLIYQVEGQGRRVVLAMVLLFGAALSDYADGLVARKQRRQSR